MDRLGGLRIRPSAITIAICCQAPNPLVIHRRTRSPAKDVNWQGFANTVDTSITAFPSPCEIKPCVSIVPLFRLPKRTSEHLKSAGTPNYSPRQSPTQSSSDETSSGGQLRKNRTEYLEARTQVRYLTKNGVQSKVGRFHHRFRTQF